MQLQKIQGNFAYVFHRFHSKWIDSIHLKIGNSSYWDKNLIDTARKIDIGQVHCWSRVASVQVGILNLNIFLKIKSNERMKKSLKFLIFQQQTSGA